jgi:transposase-like protein
MFTTDIKSLYSLSKAFPSEEACIEHIEAIRWRENVVSPFDAQSKVWKCKNGKYKCKNTGKYFNVLKGTMFENTKIELQKWFMAIWMITIHNKGVTAVDLAKDIDVSYKTALFLLHRIRANFFVENYNEQEGEIELDETMYGGKNKNRHKEKKVYNIKSDGNTSTSFKDKTLIFGMLQRNGKLNCFVIPDRSKETLQTIINRFIKKGSRILSDDYRGYKGLNKEYNHQYVCHSGKQYVNENDPSIHSNGIESNWNILKNSIRDMYNRVTDKYLQLYVDEHVFRFNTRDFIPSDRFNWLILNSGRKVTYKQLVNG